MNAGCGIRILKYTRHSVRRATTQSNLLLATRFAEGSTTKFLIGLNYKQFLSPEEWLRNMEGSGVPRCSDSDDSRQDGDESRSRMRFHDRALGVPKRSSAEGSVGQARVS